MTFLSKIKNKIDAGMKADKNRPSVTITFREWVWKLIEKLTGKSIYKKHKSEEEKEHEFKKSK